MEQLASKLKTISVTSNDINILLLGETGVGKSTFINAFANYLEYENFNSAEKETVRVLIPAQFTITNQKFEQQTIKIGKDKNENEEVGQSATLGARSYVFPINRDNTRIRLIDTPGIGDTRGIDQDQENFENILTYIGNLEYLHAICFLLKPNQPRLTVFFEFCLKALLSRLQKDASKNIIFLFTNARGTCYKPEETMPALRNVLETIRKNPPHVEIKLERNNIFCLDNEAFRFMVASKNNVKFSNEHRKNYAQSWELAVKECWRMINYLTGFDKTKANIVPHKVKDTICVNNARRVIIQLSKPLADIAQLINDNICVLQRHKRALNRDNLSKTDLESRLYVPVINLKGVELKQPVTVCTNVRCCEIYQIEGKKKYHYKQRCHEPCYLTNVPKEIVGSPELVHCYAMRGSNRKCNECSCDFSIHMHVYYMTETFSDKIIDKSIQSQINDKSSAVMQTLQIMNTIERRKKEYENEKEVITKSMAKFAHFLQHNAIAPYNDAYKSYLEHLINREESHGEEADTQLIIYYRDLIQRHVEEKKILDDALSTASNKSSMISADNIMQTVEDLYKLQHTGSKIRELYQHQSNSRNAEFFNSIEEYVLAKSLRRQQRKYQRAGRNQQKSNESYSETYRRSNSRHRNRSSSHNRQDTGNDSSNQKTKHEKREYNSGQGKHNNGNWRNSKSGNQNNRNFHQYPPANMQYPHHNPSNFNSNRFPFNIGPNQHPNNFQQLPHHNPNRFPHNSGQNYRPNYSYQWRPDFGSNPNLSGNFNQPQMPHQVYMDPHFPNNGNVNFRGPPPHGPNQLPLGPGPYPLMGSQLNQGPPPSAFLQHQQNANRTPRRRDTHGHQQKNFPSTNQRAPSGPYMPDNIDSDSGLSTKSCPSGPYKYVSGARTDSESQSSSDTESNSSDSDFDRFQRRHNLVDTRHYKELSDSDNADSEKKAFHRGRSRNKSSRFEASAKEKELPSYKTYHDDSDDGAGGNKAPGKSENRKGTLDFFQKIFM